MAKLSPMLLDRLSLDVPAPCRLDTGTWFISEKYDGWRMVYDASTDTYYSRSGEVIDVPPRMRTEMYRLNPAGYNLDGELFLGDGRFSDIRGALNANSKELTYRVFDVLTPLASYAQRYAGLKNIFDSAAEKTEKSKYIRLVEQTPMDSLDMEYAKRVMREVVARGGEGVVVRSATGLYLPGQRSKEVLKLKPVDADEVEVIGYHMTVKAAQTQAGQADDGYVSSLVCKLLDGTGKTFRVTYKSFAAPPIGSRVRIQYQSVTSTGLPRFPVLLRQDLLQSQPQLQPQQATLPGTLVEKNKKSISWLGNTSKTIEAWKAFGGYQLLPGEAVNVISARDPTQVYIVKCAQQDPSSIYCSCEAWKYQRLNPRARTCKHCIAVCGATAEKRRVAFATLQLEIRTNTNTNTNGKI